MNLDQDKIVKLPKTKDINFEYEREREDDSPLITVKLPNQVP